MISAIRYEYVRLVSLRASFRVPALAVMMAGGLGIASGLAVSAEAAPNVVALLRLLASVPVLAASVLVGAAASGHERHYAMRGITLAIVPRRLRLVAAKVVSTVLVAGVTGALGSLAAASAYSAAIAWAYAGDSTLVPTEAAGGPVTAGVVPSASAAIAGGLFGLAVGLLARWYRTSVVLAVVISALGVPLAAGALVKVAVVQRALSQAETMIRGLPGVGKALNPPVLSSWPQLQSNLHPAPLTSLPTTALLTGLALVAMVLGAVRWQRG